MESSDKRLCELVDAVMSWIPRRHEEAKPARDFWMPDHSCRVCFECDSPFTIFNRRHHCRHCGKVFCARCTSKFVPSLSFAQKNSNDEVERVRVCNFCYKQWEQHIGQSDNGSKLSGLASSFSSSTSLVSPKSNTTDNITIATGDSTSYSVGAGQRLSCCTTDSLKQFNQTESFPEKLDVARIMDATLDTGDPSLERSRFRMNRSDVDDDDPMCCSDWEAQYFQNTLDYYVSVNFDEDGQGYHSKRTFPIRGNSYNIDACSPMQSNADPDLSSRRDFSISSDVYGVEGSRDFFDFENHALLWHPPEPEDEEDEKEDGLFEDEGDGATGEWGYLRPTNSFGSGEYRNRDRSVEEQKKAMKCVLGHFRALVAQLLEIESVPVGEGDDRRWLDIITSLSWEAANFLKPDTSKVEGMETDGYVKVKCIACGRCNESMVVRGIVCKKNVANRRMKSNILKPRIVILGGALEYQRTVNQLSSFDTLLQQERDHLKMAVAKVDAHHPNILLVEKSVSRYAQDYLLEKNISLVLNIKKTLLKRLSQCTGASIVPSVDHLSSSKLGHCDLFHVEKVAEDYNSRDQEGKKLVKTLMFFEGCPKPFGCTILLKGAKIDELKKVKRVTQYAVFAAYHLALETSFLVDEGASLSEFSLDTPIAVALPDNPPNPNQSMLIMAHPMTNSSEVVHKHNISATAFPLSFNDEPRMMVTKHPSGSADSVCVLPVSDIKGTCISSNGSPIENTNQTGHLFHSQSIASQWPPQRSGINEFSHGENLPAEISDANGQTASEDDVLQITEVNGLKAYGPNLFNGSLEEDHSDLTHLIAFDQDDGEKDDSGISNEFPPSPSDHQSILVSLSRRCIRNGSVCERAHIFRIMFYGRLDKPLGRFLRDHLFDQGYRCHSCGMPSEDHVHVYTHRRGSLTISVKKLLKVILPGERDGKVWMWHRCLRCPRVNGFPPVTRRVVMSDAAWGLSFGKFLDLSFSNSAAASRVASCGHSLHRDCLRFYGFGNMVACFRYASINIHSVYLPPLKLDFNCHLQIWVRKEADEVIKEAEHLFYDVLDELSHISDSKYDFDLKLILQKEKAEFEECFLKMEARQGYPGIDILEINKLRRQLLFWSFLWDQRLILAANSYHGSHELLRNFIISNEGLNELSVDLKEITELLSLCSLDTVPEDSGNNTLNMGSSLNKQVSLDEHLTEATTCKNIEEILGIDTHISTSSIATNKFVPPESGCIVREIHSDGQVPQMSDFSETIYEDGSDPASTDERLLNSSIPVVDSSIPVVDSSISSSALCGGSEHSIGNFSSLIGIPFAKFYAYVNKNLVSFENYDALSEYQPVYVTSFEEIGHRGGARLFLPVGLDDMVVPIFDDEPTSVVSYALLSPNYHAQLSVMGKESKGVTYSTSMLQLDDGILAESSKALLSAVESLLSLSKGKSSLPNSDPISLTKAMHARISFADGKAKYAVTCYYTKYFEALRSCCCPSELDFVRSLSRCKKWGAQGGKSNVFFAKTLDERFIVKQVTKTELESFIKFAPDYFKYLAHTICTQTPTCLAKILGVYQVTNKQLKGGKECKMDLLVMENLLFGQNITKLYDLKGCTRSRYNADSSGNNKVLLDQNLIESMPTSPIFVSCQAKRALERAVWNDTAFLAAVDVMDYSLLVGVDEDKRELVVGIIDFMRQYTWDKHLETWVKTAGILGCPKNESPTVISPKQYKKRFRKAMTSYFVMVPDVWPLLPLPPASLLTPSSSRSNLGEELQPRVDL